MPWAACLAVVHPDTGVVGQECDVVSLVAKTLSESTHQGLPVASKVAREYDDVVAVQLHTSGHLAGGGR